LRVLGGLLALKWHGLNAEVPKDELVWLEADGEVIERAVGAPGGRLVAGLEDALVSTFAEAITNPEQAYWMDFFLAIYLIRIEDLDFAYMLGRAERLGVREEFLAWLETVDWTVKYGWRECDLLPENYTTYHWLADRYCGATRGWGLRPVKRVEHPDVTDLNVLVGLVRKELVWDVKLIST